MLHMWEVKGLLKVCMCMFHVVRWCLHFLWHLYGSLVSLDPEPRSNEYYFMTVMSKCSL